MDGVCSTSITGDGKDRLEVVGFSIDVVSLISRLRKKICHADIIRVPELKENKPPMSISPILTPQAMDQDNQRFNYPFPGSSSVSEESPSSSPRPASFKGKGKQEFVP
ncbi:unnamed protein product [Miscanthus lutarioriparius]|uniref:Uncharacterized protein n=1 Tax=Miscanthus lutarioriparius TaxID=422564 RepID=A0A811PXH8_9POAL|nr:unnamed protein product [Miscanthus lutarioriparius]